MIDEINVIEKPYEIENKTEKSEELKISNVINTNSSNNKEYKKIGSFSTKKEIFDDVKEVEEITFKRKKTLTIENETENINKKYSSEITQKNNDDLKEKPTNTQNPKLPLKNIGIFDETYNRNELIEERANPNFQVQNAKEIKVEVSQDKPVIGSNTKRSIGTKPIVENILFKIHLGGNNENKDNMVNKENMVNTIAKVTIAEIIEKKKANIPKTNRNEENKGIIVANPFKEFYARIMQNPPGSLPFENMYAFLTRPVDKGKMFMCNVVRNKNGLLKNPVFNVYTDKNDRYLMSALNNPDNLSANYSFSMKEGEFKNTSENFLGKLKSNFLGTIYDIWSNGKKIKETTNRSEIRNTLGCITYKVNLFGLNGPRKMKVYFPSVIAPNDDIAEFKDEKDVKHLLNKKYKERVESKSIQDNIICIENKTPRWNEKHKRYVLNFNGRVDKSSVKNFQLVDNRNNNYIYMQFGRLNEDTFSMDFQYPLSPMQAFAIAISSLDNKYALE